MWQPITGIRLVAPLLWLVIPACAAPGTPAVTATPDGSSPLASPFASAPGAPPASGPAATDDVAAGAIATIALDGGPDLPTEAFGSLWVLAVDGPLMNDGTSSAVHRIDPATNEVIASVPLPGRLCQGIGASPEGHVGVRARWPRPHRPGDE